MIPSDRAHLNVAATSHPGMSGKNNEDRYGVSAYRLNAGAVPSVLAIVADGIGGHRAGEVAAELAVEVISQAVSSSDGQDPVKTLQQALIHASQMIYQKAEADPGLKGMGTTCACAWVIGDRLYLAFVGDSRVYLVRDGVIHQLTIDHTWIQEALDAGALTQDEAQGHPNAHVIRRYLGSKNEVVPDMRIRLRPGQTDAIAEANQGLRLKAGDQVLLCSDGLTDLVSDQEILAVFQQDNLEGALKRLVELANGRGGHDNITAVTLQMPSTEPLAPTAPVQVATAPGRRARLGAGCLAGLLLSALLLVAAGGLFWFLNRTEPTRTPVVTRNPAIQETLFLSGTQGVTSTSLPGTSHPPATAATPSPAGVRPRNGTPGTPQIATLTAWPTNTSAP